MDEILLLPEIVAHINTLTDADRQLWQEISAQKSDIENRVRSSCGETHDLMTLDLAKTPLAPHKTVQGVDGACVIAPARSSTAFFGVVQSVAWPAPTLEGNQSHAYVGSIPHHGGIADINAGLMTMREILTAVSLARSSPDTTILFDGSRLSALIAINTFYQGLIRDDTGRGLLAMWRTADAARSPLSPGATLQLFESSPDLLWDFLSLPNIVGHLKYVTTNTLVKRFFPQAVNRLGDPDMVDLLLKQGDVLQISLGAHPHLSSPWDSLHLAPAEKGGYPWSDRVRDWAHLLSHDQAYRFFHIYMRLHPAPRGACKIEVNNTFLRATSEEPFPLVAWARWWHEQTASPQLVEPLLSVVVDRKVKQAVCDLPAVFQQSVWRNVAADDHFSFLSSRYRT